MLRTLVSEGGWTAIIFAIVIAATALIGGVAFGIYRLLHPKLKEERDTSNDVKEELDRVLVPVEDEETSKKIQNYQDEEE